MRRPSSRKHQNLLSALCHRLNLSGGNHSAQSPASAGHTEHPAMSGVSRWVQRSLPLMLSGTVLLSGCSLTQKKQAADLQYCDDIEGMSDLRTDNSRIAHPCLDNVTTSAVRYSQEPRSVLRRVEDEVREVSLDEIVRTALSHNKIIETSAFGGVGAKTVLQQPQGVVSIYEPSIQESGVLFGRRGLDAALSDFDATLTSSMVWGRNEVFSGVGPLSQETGTFRSQISKQFATGASVTASHNWNYVGDRIADPFLSTYTGSVGASFRQPLLAGSGVEFTRVAGPVNPAFGAIAGVSQGVVIARINQDITLADFEIAVRNGVRDIINAYWDLYFAYRSYDAAAVAHQSAFQTWKEAQINWEEGRQNPADYYQTEDRLYETRANVETSLNQLYQAEAELRRLSGMPMNDGTVIRPSSEPLAAGFQPDWNASLTEALTRRTELRRQKWSVKSLQLQLNAARSLERPQLDFVSSYGVNGVGDHLLDDRVTDPATGLPIRSGAGSLSRGDLTSWTMGVEFSMRPGFRFARSQVRNYELQLARANAVLEAQERAIAHDVATAMQNIAAAHAAATSSRKRMEAAEKRVEVFENREALGDNVTIDLVLRAQAAAATAETAYYQQLTNYNKALAELDFATGRLLTHSGVFLAEGPWEQAAHCDALLRAQERTHAVCNPNLETKPADFSSPSFVGSVELEGSPRQPTAGEGSQPPPVPVADPEIDGETDTEPLRPTPTTGERAYDETSARPTRSREAARALRDSPFGIRGL